MEIPTYNPEDSYASKFLKGYSIFQEDSRIFHQVGYEYDYVVALESAHFDGRVLQVQARLLSGQEASLSVEAVRHDTLRLKVWQGRAAFADESPMLMPLPEATAPLTFSETPQSYVLTFGQYRLLLDRRPFCMRVLAAGGEAILESETEKLVGLYTAPPLGFRYRGVDRWAFLSWRMRNTDRFYGLGEKFTRFEKTSTRATIWEEDTCGSNTTDLSYKSVPVLLSTAGWAMMLHTSFRSHWEIGSFSYATGSAMVEDRKLDLFLMLAPTLKEQIGAYTALTGRPQLPPKWALGLWMSRAAYRNRTELLEVANRLRAEGIPCDVFSIDPTWLTKQYYDDIGVEVCNMDWNTGPWGEPAALFAELAAQGFSVCLWINPYFSEDSVAYAEAAEKGYLVKDASGGISRLEFGLAAGMVDFTNPAARAWWKEKLAGLLRLGAAVFKADFGDRVPEDALFFNGKTGAEMHNLYVHLYVGTVHEAVREVHGVGMVWRRPGYIGSQRYPGTWAGDTQVTWEGMRGALRGGLSAAMTGEAFWSHDMGGFVGRQPSRELYIRWAQFGLLSPLSRFHGTTPREPWHYGREAVDIVRHYVRLRYSLIPYLLATAQESVATGLPILRPLVLEFPAEPCVDQIDDQYLLGPDLLAAPVFQDQARSRPVYFPTGTWYSLEDPGHSVVGPGFRTIEAPLERMPLFVRAGAIIPRYTKAPDHLKGPTPKEWTLDIYPGESNRSLQIHETDFSVRMGYQSSGTSATLQVSPAPLTLALRLIGCYPAAVEINGAAAQWQTGDGYSSLVIDAKQGVTIRYRWNEGQPDEGDQSRANPAPA